MVAAIGAGIARQFGYARPPSRAWAALAVASLAIALLFTLFEWFRHLVPIGSILSTARVDRLLVFDKLAEPTEGGWIAMVASLVWVIAAGERAQREFVASRSWRPVAEAQTFPGALEACEALGPGWTLPRPAELAAYLATRPDALRTWTGVVWTNTAAEHGASGIVVEVAARRAGVWRPGRMGERSVTDCETDTRDRRPIDVFTRRKAWVCEATLDSPYLHASDLVPVVLRQGTAAEFGQAGAVCVQRGERDVTRGPGTQQYPRQQAFSTAAEYLTFIKE